MDIVLQGGRDLSNWKKCIFEQQTPRGLDRYEFRCAPEKECCELRCCVPGEDVATFLLMALLGLMVVFAIIGYIANRRRYYYSKVSQATCKQLEEQNILVLKKASEEMYPQN